MRVEFVRRYADAVRAFDRALSLAPDLHDAAIWRGWTYVTWQGQLDTLRAELNRLPRDAELGPAGDVAPQRASLLQERNADSLLQMLQITPVDVFVSQGTFLPSALELCSGQQALLFVRGLTLCHMDAVLRRQEEARRLLLGDVEAELAVRGVDVIVHRP